MRGIKKGREERKVFRKMKKKERSQSLSHGW